MSSATLMNFAAGVFFGIWPLLMQRSGLRATESTVLLVIAAFVIVIPIGLISGTRTSSFAGSSWGFAVLAGVALSMGFFAFNGALAQATPETVGRTFLIMLMVQLAVPAIYHGIMAGGISLKTGLGFVAAIAATLLLL